ncbi:MAG: pyridoxamine 5'-phosphate oxidase family protein [Chloroflexota bacterium]|nr:pyridoxamine 5'-phosphate oxidase family protein [Chloroflexota bacterium]
MAERKYPEWMGKMRALTDEEIAEFLEEPIVARLGTVMADGTPYVSPVWQEYDPEEKVLYIVGREKSAYVKHLQRIPRVSVSCARDNAPYTRALFIGEAEIVEGPVTAEEGTWQPIADRMALRYLGERGPEYLEPTLDRPRYLIKVTPNRVISWEGVEWADRYLEIEEEES